MQADYSISGIIKELKEDPLYRSRIPETYSPGLPLIVYRNSNLCMMIPFLRYHNIGKKDGILVYQIRYVITVDLPEISAKEPEKGKRSLCIVKYEDLAFDPDFSGFEFNMPVGLFRHPAVKNYTKSQYDELRKELFSLYDKLAVSLLDSETEMSSEEINRMRELFRTIVEPSTLKVYQKLDGDFFGFLIG